MRVKVFESLAADDDISRRVVIIPGACVFRLRSSVGDRLKAPFLEARKVFN